MCKREELLSSLPLDPDVSLFVDSGFDDRSQWSQILGEMPDREKFEAKKRKTDLARKGYKFPSHLRPCYEEAILTKSQEHHMFRKYNLYKYRARKSILVCHYARAEKFLEQAWEIKRFLGNCNARLAANIAKKYGPYDVEDTTSEAYVRLMASIDRFNYMLGIKFSTFATWCIRREVWTLEKKRLKKYKTEFTAKFMDDELESPVGYNEEGEALIRDAWNKELVAKYLNLIPDERYADVIRCRYGLEGREPLVLTEVGRKYGISKERVRQIEIRAIEMIREHI